MSPSIAATAVPQRKPAPSGFVLIVALLALVAGSKAILFDTLDPDCFWHLRVAGQLQRDGVGPIIDDISFASIKTPWTPYSWLAELGMKRLWDGLGWRAAVAAQALMMAGIVTLIALACRELAGPMNAVAATIFACYWTLPYLSFRPVTLCILLMALCVWLLVRDRRLDQRSRGAWWIVPATLINANVHFLAMLVPVLPAALLGAAIWERAHRRSIMRYAALLGATLAASLATPMLPGMIRAAVHYQTSDPTLAGGFINEFRPFYAGPMGGVSVALLAGAVACIVWNRHRLGTGERLWVLIGIVLLVRLGRFAPMFAILTAPALAATLPRMGTTVLERPPIRAALAILVLSCIVRLATAFPAAHTPLHAWLNRHGPDTPGYPCAAADFVAQHVPTVHGRILNEFAWGGYLGWRLEGRFQVLMDGRTQLYTPAFWRNMYGRGQVNPAHIPPGADAAVVPIRGSRLKGALVELGWQRVHLDDRAEVLVPRPVLADVER